MNTEHRATDPAQLIEPAGRGAELFDAPAVFYLTFRHDIERWHALREQALESFDAWMADLADDVAAVGHRHDLDTAAFDTAGGYRHYLLHHSDTPAVHGVPALAVCLGWRAGRASPTGKTYAPFVGVRADPDHSDHQQLREQFLGANDDAGRGLRNAHGFKGDRQWPVWTPVPGADRWWTDLDSYREKLMSELDRVADIFGPLVDHASGAL